MSCRRVVLEFIVAGGQGLIARNKKATSKDGLIACSSSRLRIYDCELTVVLLSQHWSCNQLNKLNQRDDYTLPDENMLHIAETSAEKNKITGVDFIRFDSSAVG
jgi:hypothetical protein